MAKYDFLVRKIGFLSLLFNSLVCIADIGDCPDDIYELFTGSHTVLVLESRHGDISYDDLEVIKSIEGFEDVSELVYDSGIVLGGRFQVLEVAKGNVSVGQLLDIFYWSRPNSFVYGDKYLVFLKNGLEGFDFSLDTCFVGDLSNDMAYGLMTGESYEDFFVKFFYEVIFSGSFDSGDKKKILSVFKNKGIKINFNQ